MMDDMDVVKQPNDVLEGKSWLSFRKRIDDEILKEMDKVRFLNIYQPICDALQGGKRIRAILVLMANQVYDEPQESASDAMKVAVAIEMLHAAALVHDDIMDNSDYRRNEPTIYKKYGTDTAILAGNFLISLAFKLANSVKAKYAAGCSLYLCDICMELVDGQLLDINSFDTEDLDSYYKLIDGKTSSIISLPMKILGVINENEQLSQHLFDYAREVARILQILDDFYDAFIGDEKTSKTPGLDRLNGKKTIVDLVSNKDDLESMTRTQVKKAIQVTLAEHREAAHALLARIDTPNTQALSDLDAYVWHMLTKYTI
ncbi:polyprenyl synthetase family protein [Pseudoalteromonas sp. JC3]|uniref:polyprenyl synthetase family protein n=1 Tax=Pseudoalteromonas sp. JC3 TaxID=2810196 RepID=UPI0019D15BD5|nr:polyprenyl synthetase family protein [Pseudoalteromonas sp. JC3]MBR8845350.1 polyprenyl synthetase family protein [Pseudoalteromonas sp. JC3]WJE07779.1 polyprenyl synthetase family protein [Pseudoalteromonas sp. JC3]